MTNEAHRDKVYRTAYDKFLAENPEFAAAVKLAEEYEFDTTADRHVESKRAFAASTIRDIASKVYRYRGDISPKAQSFAEKLGADLAAPRPEPETKIAAPEGRQEITGTVVSVKSYEGFAYGSPDVWKMLVKVETPDGNFVVWSTVPAAIENVYHDDGDFEKGLAGWLRGRTVTFTATLTRGDEPHFARAKRPSKAKMAA